MSNRSSHWWRIIHVHGMGFLLECMMYKYIKKYIKVPAGLQVQGMGFLFLQCTMQKYIKLPAVSCKYSAPASWCLVLY